MRSRPSKSSHRRRHDSLPDLQQAQADGEEALSSVVARVQKNHLVTKSLEDKLAALEASMGSKYAALPESTETDATSHSAKQQRTDLAGVTDSMQDFLNQLLQQAEQQQSKVHSLIVEKLHVMNSRMETVEYVCEKLAKHALADR